MSLVFLRLLASAAFLCQLVALYQLVVLAPQTRTEPPRIADPTKVRDVPGGLASRVAADRARLVKERGGSAAAEAAVARGLKWLALHQAPDGRWSLNEFNKHFRRDLKATKYEVDPRATGRGLPGAIGDTAGTAFGLLPFLAAGITHKTTEKQPGGEYAETVKRGLDYLLQKQTRDGDFGGNMYSHGLA